MYFSKQYKTRNNNHLSSSGNSVGGIRGDIRGCVKGGIGDGNGRMVVGLEVVVVVVLDLVVVGAVVV
jgi:hypothetical protein